MQIGHEKIGTQPTFSPANLRVSQRRLYWIYLLGNARNLEDEQININSIEMGLHVLKRKLIMVI